MANNRMFLVHIPSKTGVMIGKQLAGEWYKAPKQKKIKKFYAYIDKNYGHYESAFILLMENNHISNPPFPDWCYKGLTKEGFRKFDLGDY